MDKHLFYALLGGTINVVLSSAVPCLIKKKDKSFFGEMRQVYETNRKSILVSSLIIVITIYIVLKVGPNFKPLLERLSNDNNTPSENMFNLRRQIIPLNNFFRL